MKTDRRKRLRAGIEWISIARSEMPMILTSGDEQSSIAQRHLEPLPILPRHSRGAVRIRVLAPQTALREDRITPATRWRSPRDRGSGLSALPHAERAANHHAISDGL
jgi:hypothetical protein